MKYVSLFAITLFSALSIGAPRPIAPMLNVDSLYGPFDGTTNPEIKITCSRIKDGTKLRVNYYYLNDGRLYCVENYNLDNYKVKTIAVLNYILQIKNRLCDGVKIEFIFLNNDEQLDDPIVLKILPILSESIDAFEYKYKNYKIENRTFKITSSRVTSNIEEFSFVNTIDELYLKSDNSLPIDYINFSYIFNQTNISENGDYYLRIRDLNNNFPFLNKDNNFYTYIPIKLNNNDGEISLKSGGPYYVNPNTLDMSLEYHTGFIETDRFYINPTIFNKLSNDDITFILNNVGYNNLTITFPYKISKELSPIGFCYNSSYCISGGIKK